MPPFSSLFPLRLRTVTLLVLLAVGLVPLGVITLANLPYTLENLEQAARARSMAALTAESAELGRRLERYQETARLLSKLPAPLEMVASRPPDESGLQLSEVQARERFAALMIRWFGDNRVVREIAVLAPDREYLRLQRVAEELKQVEPGTRRPVLTEQVLRDLLGRRADSTRVQLQELASPSPVVAIASPLLLDGEAPAGAVVLRLALEDLLATHRDAIWVGPGGHYIHSPGGVLVGRAATRDHPGLGLAMTRSDPEVFFSSETGMAWLPVEVSSGTHLWIGRPLDLSGVDEGLARYRNRFLAIALLLAGAVFLLSRRTTALVDRFKQQLTGGMDRLIRGDPTVQFHWSGPLEIRQFARELNLLAERHHRADQARRSAETALAAEKARAETTLNSIGDAVITVDASGRVDYVNPVAEQLVGYRAAEIRRKQLADCCRFLNEDTGRPIGDLATFVQMAEQIPTRVLLQPRAGDPIPVEPVLAPLKGGAGGTVMVLRDHRQQYQLQQRLAYLATHDSLTGLLNRREFEVRLAKVLDRLHANPGPVHWLCYIDLDQFKIINDTSGHMAGDEQLKQVAELLNQQLTPEDCVARMGGDEFAILLMDRDGDTAFLTVERIREVMHSEQFIWGNRSFPTSASFGLVPVNHRSSSVRELLSTADAACFIAKDAGRNRIHVYQEDDEAIAQQAHQMQWVHRIRRALDEDRFVLYFQPIVRLDGTRDLHHGEILLRMVDEEGKLVPPGSFIPAAERYNLMVDVDRWVIRKTLDRIGRLGADHELLLSVNLSAQSLVDESFLELVLEKLEASGVPGRYLCFEITETAAISNLSRAIRFINRLTDAGCGFALDDFGSGLSSFGYLKNLPVDFLKIDGSFVRDMLTDPINRGLVEAIHQVGKTMGIETVAEFVESESICDALRGIGVDYGQGFAIAHPISFDVWAARTFPAGKSD